MRSRFSVLTLSLVTALGCSTGEIGTGGEVVGDQEVEISSALKLMENHPNCEDVEVRPDGLTFLWRTDASDVDVAVGNIVVGERGGGYVRRISSIVTEGNRIHATTEPATLADAVLAGEFSMPLVQPNDWAQCPAGTACAATDLVDLSGTVIFDGIAGGAALTVSIPRGRLEFSPAVDFDMSVGFPGVIEHLRGTVSGTFLADLDVEVTAEGAVELGHEVDVSGPEAPLYSVPFTFVAPTPLGPLPVVGTANLDVFVGFRARTTAAATVATGVTASAALELGATYDDGAWSATAEPAFDVSHDPIELAGEAATSVEAYARPEVNVVFYGVAGPRFGLEPLLRLTRELVPPDPERTTLDACLRGELGFSVQILSFSIADFSQSLERCLPLFDSDEV